MRTTLELYPLLQVNICALCLKACFAPGRFSTIFCFLVGLGCPSLGRSSMSRTSAELILPEEKSLRVNDEVSLIDLLKVNDNRAPEEEVSLKISH